MVSREVMGTGSDYGGARGPTGGAEPRGSGRGELVSEPSAAITETVGTSLRKATLLYLLPGLVLLATGLLLWIVVNAAWYVFVPFVGAGAFLAFMGSVLLSILTAVPRMQVFEGGVLVKVGRGAARYHPWSDFTTYRTSTFKRMEVLELRLRQEGTEPISIIEEIPAYGRVKELVMANVAAIEDAATSEG